MKAVILFGGNNTSAVDKTGVRERIFKIIKLKIGHSIKYA
jgi:hypothetical protein